MDAALHTAELVETVLAHLPFYDLIRCQRVCTLWRDIIARSTPIRQKLFLFADEIRDRWAAIGAHYKDVHFIQLSQMTLLPPTVQVEFKHGYQTWQGPEVTPKHVYPVRLHPMLQNRPILQGFSEGGIVERNVAQDALITDGTRCCLSRALRDISTTSSWRHMYVCNPPCTKLMAWITFTFSWARVRSRSKFVSMGIEESSGITFGHIVDRILARLVADEDENKFGADNTDCVQTIEELYRRGVCVEATEDGKDCTIFRIDDVVAPSEQEWKDVATAARQVE